jgi:hypothetical protein
MKSVLPPTTAPVGGGPAATLTSGHDPASGEEALERTSTLRRWWPALVCLAVYALLASTLYGNHSWLSSSQIPICSCRDEAQEVWFLQWTSFAIGHGHSPFFSSWLNYPHGVDLAINTSMPLLGVIGAPITWLHGPVATYNFLLRLGFVVSALSMCLVLRRWTTWWPAAFVGGLAYGFSTYMVGQGIGHAFLTFIPIPPLIFLMVDEIIGRRRWPAYRAGIVLGLLCAAQYLISQEILAITVLAVLMTVTLVALAGRQQIALVIRHVLVAAGWAAGVSGVLLAYPAWMAVAGPQHIRGPPHTLSGLSGFVGDALGIIVPTHVQRLAPQSLASIGAQFTGGSPVENGEYLGLPLLVLIAASTIAYRKHRILVLVTTMMVIAWILSLGRRLTIDGHVTPVRLPFDVLIRIPFVQDILPVRFSVLIALFGSAALAIGLDLLRRSLAAGPAGVHAHHRSRRRRAGGVGWVASAAVLVLAAVAVAPLVPRHPFPSFPTGVPSLFTTPAVAHIPQNSVVLTYPYPFDPALQGMLDQASANMWFKIVGTDLFIPGPDGSSFEGSEVLSPPQVQTLFYSAYFGGPIPSLATAIPAIRTYVSRYQISTVVFYRVGVNPDVVVRYLTAALGPPTKGFGVTQWFDVQARLRHAVPASP